MREVNMDYYSFSELNHRGIQRLSHGHMLVLYRVRYQPGAF